MNQRDKLKEQKKRLWFYLGLNQDVMCVINGSVKALHFTTFTMLKENQCGQITTIQRTTNSLYFHLLKRILSNFYYFVRHIITLLSGVRRLRTKPCGSDSVELGR